MRIEIYNPNTKQYTFPHAGSVVWTGQHIFVHEGIYSDAPNDYTATHRGTGRQLLPTTENQNLLIATCRQLEAADLDWSALRQYTRHRRRGTEDLAQVEAIRDQIKPYWLKIWHDRFGERVS